MAINLSEHDHSKPPATILGAGGKSGSPACCRAAQPPPRRQEPPAQAPDRRAPEIRMTLRRAPSEARTSPPRARGGTV